MDGVTSNEALLEVAKDFGTPLRAPNGEIIKRLRPSNASSSIPKTFTDRFGCGQFPLHTDTAFWTPPVRYILCRVTGDFRRTTQVLPFTQITRDVPANLLQEAVWKILTPRHAFYCSMLLRVGGICGYRYDSNCMRPANNSARELDSRLQDAIVDHQPESIQWTDGLAVVVDNWQILHGRGSPPKDEQERNFFRIYVS